MVILLHRKLNLKVQTFDHFHITRFDLFFLFSDVIKAIKIYAFKSTPYPLTLSIENHCGLAQQEKMAQIFEYELKGLLLRPDDFENKECPGWLPSPDQLKRKILIKGKKVKVGGGNYEEDEYYDETEIGDDNATIASNAYLNSFRPVGNISKSCSKSFDKPDQLSTRHTESKDQEFKEIENKKTENGMSSVKLMSSMTHFLKKKEKTKSETTDVSLSNMTHFDTCRNLIFDANTSCARMKSVSETRSLKAYTQNELPALIKQNSKYMR
jgi:hypothetical protein